MIGFLVRVNSLSVANLGTGTNTEGTALKRRGGGERGQMSCPFEKLGLPPSASKDDVKAAYRLLGIYAHLPFQAFACD